MRLAIYSVLGQEVRVLVNERKEAGSFTVTWDGTGCTWAVVWPAAFICIGYRRAVSPL